MKDFGKPEGRKRGHLGRLEHHRIAHGKRRAGLPAGDLDRIVPSADADTDPKRLTARIAEGSAKLDLLAIEGGDRPAEEFERLGSRRGIGDKRFLQRLAGVQRFELCQFLIVRKQEVCRPAQDTAALDRLQPGPGRLGGAGGLHREFDNVGRGRMDAGDGLAGGGIDDLYHLALFVFDMTAIDVVRCFWLRAHGVSSFRNGASFHGNAFPIHSIYPQECSSGRLPASAG